MARDEIYDAIHYMIENLKPALASNASASIAEAYLDFNSLLARAKKAYPQIATVQEAQPLSGGTTVAALMTKLSALQGAISSQRR